MRDNEFVDVEWWRAQSLQGDWLTHGKRCAQLSSKSVLLPLPSIGLHHHGALHPIPDST